VLLLVHAPEDVLWAAAAGVGALFALNLWLLITLTRDFGRLDLSFDLEAWRTLLPPALPIAGSVFMIAIYYNLDQVILGLFRDETEVGWYAAGCRAMSAALLPSLVFGQAFFPALSSAFGDIEAMRERASAFAASMIPVGLPIGIGMALLAQPLLVLFAGEDYAPGGPALAVLMLNAALVYFNMVYGQSLLAWNYQRTYMLAVGTGAVINLILNFILIPRYGPIGAAIATFAAQSGAFVWVWIAHRRITGSAYGGVFVRALAATLLAVVVPILLGQHLAVPLIPLLLAVAVLYGGLAWVMGLVPRALLDGLRPA
jgi:O-antigen/teichoic acid export membrane protein